jgi:CheY-like chemotaxis protein
MDTHAELPHVVLLVDDNAADRVMAQRSLSRSDTPIDLRVAADGSEAMDYLLRRGSFADPATSPKPDVILLDLNMPRMSGGEVLEQLHANPALRRIPVIVLTSSDLDRDILQSYDLGANAYVVKPVTLESFVDAMEAMKAFWFRNEFVRRPANPDGANKP